MAITSVDVANCIRLVCHNKYNQQLSCMQTNKLSYFCYGLYLIMSGQCLFDDSKPEAWLFGPVFPRVYNTFYCPVTVSDDARSEIKNTPLIAKVISYVIENYHTYSAFDLSAITHGIGSPWYETVKSNTKEVDGKRKVRWRGVISDELIKSNFELTNNASTQTRKVG